MIEQMNELMSEASKAESLENEADEKKLRERILATQQLVRELQQQYQDIYGCPPIVPSLGAGAGAAVDGAQFCAGVEDAQDSIDGRSVLERERQIEQYEAAGGFADTDPDGMG